MFKKFENYNYTVYEIWKNKKDTYKNVLFIKNLKKHNIKISFFKKGKYINNCKFYFNFKNLKYWFLIIRLPFLYFHKNNGYLDIGTNNKYFRFNNLL